MWLKVCADSEFRTQNFSGALIWVALGAYFAVFCCIFGLKNRPSPQKHQFWSWIFPNNFWCGWNFVLLSNFMSEIFHRLLFWSYSTPIFQGENHPLKKPPILCSDLPKKSPKSCRLSIFWSKKHDQRKILPRKNVSFGVLFLKSWFFSPTFPYVVTISLVVFKSKHFWNPKKSNDISNAESILIKHHASKVELGPIAGISLLCSWNVCAWVAKEM